MSKGKRRIKLGKKIVEALDIPEEALLNVPKLTMMGKEHLLVENHKGVFEYDDGFLRLDTTEGMLRISGANLILLELSESRICVGGQIKAAEYETRGAPLK